MRAVYLSSAHECGLLESEGGPRVGDVIVPLGVSARYDAERRGWNVRSIASFLPEAEHAAARTASEAIIGETIRLLNSCYRERLPALELNLGEYFRFDLHVILGQVHFTTYVLESIARSGVRQHKSYLNERTSSGRFLGIRPHPDALVSEVAPRLFPGLVEVTRYQGAGATANFSLKRKLRQKLSAAHVDALYGLNWRARKALARISSIGARRLLVLGGQFDWKPVLAAPEFMSRYRPTFLAATDYPEGGGDRGAADATRRILDGAVSGDRGTPAWTTAAFAERIASAADYMRRRHASFRKRLQSVDAVVTSVFVTPLQVFVGDMASRLGKPVICYQHGEQNVFPEIFEGRLEATFSTHYFAYGEGVAPKYRDLIGKSRLREVAVVGSTGKKPEYVGGELILYATGKWFKTARPFLHYPDPDERLYKAHQALLRFLEDHLARHASAEIVIKANNTDLFNEMPYRTPLTIDYTSRFTALLGRAKAVILDTPATTVIEAASTPVPLFVLSGRTPWYDRPMALLRKRAIVEDNTETLMKKLYAFLESGQYEADPANREFSDAYGGLGSREDSMHRVNQELARIIA